MIEHRLDRVEDVRSGEHITAFIESPDELYGIAVPYLRAGIEAGGAAVLVTSAPRRKEILQRLKQDVGPVAEDWVREGRLIFPNVDELERVLEAAASGELGKMLVDFLGAKKVRKGVCSLLLDMESIFPADLDRKQVLAMESQTRAYLRRNRLRKLCVWRQGAFPPETLLAALSGHSQILIDGRIVFNIHYIPPKYQIGKRAAAAELRQKLINQYRITRLTEDLVDSLRRFQRLSRHNPLGVLVMQSEDRPEVRYWNEPAEQLLEDVLEQKGAQELYNMLISARDGEEFPLSPAPGRETSWLRIWKTPVQWLGRQAMLFTIWDGTPLHNALMTQHVLQTAMEAVDVGVVIFSRAGDLIFANTEFWNMAGLPLPGKPDLRLDALPRLRPEFSRLEEARSQVFDAGEAFEEQFHLFQENRKPRSIRVTATSMDDPRTRTEYVIFMFHDITEQETMQARLRRSETLEAIGQLAGGVAHDFNNLLMVIQSCVEFIEPDLPADARSREDLDEIRRAAKRAAEITRKLLTLSRRQILRPQEIDVHDALTDLQKMLRRLLPENIEILYRPGPNVTKVRMDPGEFDRVFLNLAVNARDAMPRGGTLAIRTRRVQLTAADAKRMVELTDIREGPYVEIEVRDSGCGIPRDVLSRIWQPFFTTKKRSSGSGTGLGLSTVLGAVRQAEGHIAMDSTVGAGATFWIYLPLVEEPASDGERAAVTLPRSRGEKVLVVEDDPSVRRLIVRQLEELGYATIDAESSETALALPEEQKKSLDLVITDVLLTGMDGREMADRLQAMAPGLKVLFVSGYPEEEISRHGALEAGVRLLQKPFAREDLARAVREALDAE